MRGRLTLRGHLKEKGEVELQRLTEKLVEDGEDEGSMVERRKGSLQSLTVKKL